VTLHRLIFREILIPLVLALFIVVQLLVVMQMLGLNEVLLGSGFDPVGVLKVASYLAPHFGIIAVPLAFLLAVMLGLGRLAEDNELAAMQALGRSPLMLYAVPSAMAVVLAGAVAGLSFWGEPWGLRGIHRQLNELIKKNVVGDIRPHLFYEDIPRFTVLVEDVKKDGAWNRVLLHDAVGDGVPYLLTAKKGRIETEGADSVLRLQLGDGELHRAGADDGYTRARFEEASIALGVQNFVRRKNNFIRPASELDFDEMTQAAQAARAAGDHGSARRILSKFHSRIAQIFTCLIFGLIAVPLAAGGRGARARSFVATVLTFAGYYVLQTIGNGLGEEGRASPVVGAWLPNAGGLLVAAVLAWRLYTRRSAGSR
jgi:lipopolysaccharide export system permease protein